MINQASYYERKREKGKNIRKSQNYTASVYLKTVIFIQLLKSISMFLKVYILLFSPSGP